MGVTVVGTDVSSNSISSDIRIDMPEGLSATDKNIIKDEVGELLIETILLNVGNARSPFVGDEWPPLSSAYRREKLEDGRGSTANLELFGDMLNALEFVRIDEGVRLQVTGSQAEKADGHNNFSGKSKIPTRRFLPKRGDKFKGDIDTQVDNIVSQNLRASVNVSRNDVLGITTKRQLNSFIASLFPQVPLSQAKNAILLDDTLRRIFLPVLGLF